MLDMKFLDPVLVLFKNPVADLSFKLDKSHPSILKDLDDLITDNDELPVAYAKVMDLLKGVMLKLCVIHTAWLKGTTDISNQDVIEITVGLNYEIEEARYHLIRLGMVMLPVMKSVSKTNWEEYKKLLLKYYYGAHYISPDRFVKDIDMSIPSGYSETDIMGFRAHIAIPTIEFVNNIDFCQGTIWSKGDIDGFLDRNNVISYIHPSISLLVKFCNDIELLSEFLAPENFEGSLPTDKQKAILCLFTILSQWPTVNIGSLLKDEQTFTIKYREVNKSNARQVPYTVWREAIITESLSPMVNISTSLN